LPKLEIHSHYKSIHCSNAAKNNTNLKFGAKANVSPPGALSPTGEN